MRTALIEHHKKMMKSHLTMSKMLERHGNAMDDDHEHKTAILKLAEHHQEVHGHHHELVKALSVASNDPEQPRVGSESNRGGTGSDLPYGDLSGPKAHRVFAQTAPDNLRLIARPGMAPLEKAKVSPGLEEALDI